LFDELVQAEALLERTNGKLQQELLTRDSAKGSLERYARLEKLASFGKTVLARKLDDAAEVACHGRPRPRWRRDRLSVTRPK
jgi:hypothetical protein